MEMDVRALNALIPVFDFVGIVAFALSGVFEGIKRRIDPVGVFIVAFSTAFGGGMLRDILIDRRPFYWIDHEAYVVATFIICMAAPFIYKFFQKTKHAHDLCGCHRSRNFLYLRNFAFPRSRGALAVFRHHRMYHRCVRRFDERLLLKSDAGSGCRPPALCGCWFYRMLVLHHAAGTQSSGRRCTLGRFHFHYRSPYGLRVV